MLHKQINHSPDIKKLRNLGYEVKVKGNYLLIENVPYLNNMKKVLYGTLISDITIINNAVAKPQNHVAFFRGEYPHNADGTIISQIQHSNSTRNLTSEIVINHSFSNKPPNGYDNYFHKMEQYIKIISAPAESIDSRITAKTFKVIECVEQESVHHYYDTNSTRAEIDAISEKLANQKIAIVGVGGTGSYILDQIAKTIVQEIHIFDGDLFLQHNAFRAPGAPALDELSLSMKKVEYYSSIYSKMHKNIIAHDYFIRESNVGALKGMDFVFLCLDRGDVKKCIIKKLEEENISFIDTGIGVERVEDSLIGMVRTTASTNKQRDHIWKNDRISFADDNLNNEYAKNIQIAELNSLNASLAVIKWKKLIGFYNDLEFEFNSTYAINVNYIQNEDNET